MSTTRTRRGLAAATILSVLILVAFGAFALTGCGSDSSTGGEASPAASASAGPITVTDGTGTAVTMDQPAARIVSLAPANTEIAYAIGAGDKMVAGTSYDDYPEEATSLPKIGDFANPNVEKIASFEPDLVLAAGGIQDKLRSKLENLGMKVYVVDPKTYDGVMTDITNLGQLTGSTEQAQQVADTMQKAKDDVQAQVASAAKVGDLPRDLQQAAHDRRRRDLHRRHDRAGRRHEPRRHRGPRFPHLQHRGAVRGTTRPSTSPIPGP